MAEYLLTRVRVLKAAALIVDLEIDEGRFRQSNYYYVKYGGNRISTALSIGEAEQFVNAIGIGGKIMVEKMAAAARNNVLVLAGNGNGHG